MKIADCATEYLLIKAFTNSEWDACDFVIIHVTPEWWQRMQKRLDLVTTFNADDSFYCQAYWDYAPTFYRKTYDEEEEIPDETEDWCFVTLDEKELSTFPTPENTIGTLQLHVYKQGYASYKGNGKHTGEEFYTADFNIVAVIEKMAMKY